MNEVKLIGHLGQDVEFKNLGFGQDVATFTIATTKTWMIEGQKHESTQWHNIQCWGWSAKYCRDNLSKGCKVLVMGEISYDKYKDKEGVDKYFTRIKAKQVFKIHHEKKAKEDDKLGDKVPDENMLKESDFSNEEIPF